MSLYRASYCLDTELYNALRAPIMESHIVGISDMGWLQTCHQLSEGSKRETQFYELDLQVKGASSLEESLVSKAGGINRTMDS